MFSPRQSNRPKRQFVATNQGKIIAAATCLSFLLYIVYSTGEPSLADDMITRQVGLRGRKDFKLFFWFEGHKISPWHDLPLHPFEAPTLHTFVCEIPKGATAKLEINKEAAWNPIIQDVKKGELRHYHTPSLVNYGAFPQTWEDPTENTGDGQGDNDPLDVLEIGKKVATVGEIYNVKVLGALGMVDDGEVDWKIIAVRDTDPLATDPSALKALLEPGSPLRKHVDTLTQWFRVYKVPDGKPENTFMHNGSPVSAAEAKSVIDHAHRRWQALTKRAVDNPDEFWLGSSVE